jgi:hypothetical protein
MSSSHCVALHALLLLPLLSCLAAAQPLHDAAAEGDLDRVAELLEGGANVNQANAGAHPACSAHA